MHHDSGLVDDLIQSCPQDSFVFALLYGNRDCLLTDEAREHVQDVDSALDQVMMCLFMERLARLSPLLADAAYRADDPETLQWQIVAHVAIYLDVIQRMCADLAEEGVTLPESIPLFTVAMMLVPDNDVEYANNCIAIAQGVVDKVRELGQEDDAAGQLIRYQANFYRGMKYYACGAEKFRDAQGEIHTFQEYLEGEFRNYAARLVRMLA
ncbi:MAG: hypothetical protein KQJ78_18440 [Deltaproteobacteria bacterium]|nr:hypothetical protein [Deltaproteobacteria bacterium]